MPPTRTRKAKSNKPAASAAKGRGKKVTAAIVIEDSEDEVAVDLDRTPAPSGSTRSMRGTRATDTSTVRGDPTPTTSGETRIPGTSMAPGPSTGNARGRRRLLDAEDEVDTAVSTRALRVKLRLAHHICFSLLKYWRRRGESGERADMTLYTLHHVTVVQA